MNSSGAAAERGGGIVGLVYVLLLLLVLGGGGVAVWFLYERANTPPPPTPSPAPPKPSPLGQWARHVADEATGGNGRWIDNTHVSPPAAGGYVDFPPGLTPSVTLDECKTACTGRPAALYKPSWLDKDYIFDENSRALSPGPFPLPVQTGVRSIQALSHVAVKPGDPHPCQCTTIAVPSDWTSPSSVAAQTYPWPFKRFVCVDDQNFENSTDTRVPPGYGVLSNFDALFDGGISCGSMPALPEGQARQ